MNKKKLQMAFAAYSKTRDLKALANTLKELLLYMAENAEGGYDTDFLDTLPFIVEFLNSLDFKKDNS